MTKKNPFSLIHTRARLVLVGTPTSLIQNVHGTLKLLNVFQVIFNRPIILLLKESSTKTHYKLHTNAYTMRIEHYQNLL